MAFFTRRELTHYPTGSRRRWLLFMAVVANLVANYEGQLSPILPLLLDDLDMSLETYGLVAAASVVAGAVAAGFGGRLSDRVGRVRLLIPSLFLTAGCVYLMVLVHSPRDLLIVRCVLSFVEGAAVTTTAGLVRDFSPRMGRATAFGFWTWGPVGASFLAAAVAGWTLPLFDHAWRSQMVIMGTVALILTAVIALNLADLPAGLRAQAIRSEEDLAQLDVPDGGVELARVRELLRYRHIWAHLAGVTMWLVFFYTLAVYGPAILTASFGLTAAQAARIGAVTWVLNVGTLIVVGRISDRYQVRKPFVLAGALAGTLAITYFAALVETDASIVHVTAAMGVVGMCLSVTFCPWMAAFSENAEDIRPDLQGSAWGLFGLCVRVMVVVMLLSAPLTVQAAASWRPWLLVAAACHALLVPAVFAFRGPWRPVRAGEGQSAERTPREHEEERSTR